jgi:hypothetical protein
MAELLRGFGPRFSALFQAADRFATSPSLSPSPLSPGQRFGNISSTMIAASG